MALMYLARVTRKMVEQLTKSRKHAHKKLGNTKNLGCTKGGTGVVEKTDNEPEISMQV